MIALLKGNETITLTYLGQTSLVSWVNKIGCSTTSATFALHKVDIATIKHLFYKISSTFNTMDEDLLKCEYCGRSNFRSQSGLTKHQLNPNKGGCFGKIRESYGSTANFKTAAAYLPCDAVFKPTKQQMGAEDAVQYAHMLSELGAMAAKYYNLPSKTMEPFWVTESQKQANQSQTDHDMEDNFGELDDDSDSDDDFFEVTQGSVDSSMLDNFQAYLKKAADFAPFTGKQEAAIKLLLDLRHTKASLDTYETIMRWHLETNGRLHPRESLFKSPHFVSRNKLYNELKIRYNRDIGFGNVTEIILPSTKAKAKIVWNDSKMVVQSLLIDPRAKPEHYLWFDDDPFAPPPAEQDYISDLNTGKSFRETHKKLITKPGKQILCGILVYTDAAATGQFVNNPINAVKIALGIHTRLARQQGLFWGTIGYIPCPTKVKSKGQRQLVDSGHADGAIPYYEMMDDEGELKDNTAKNGKAPVHTAQDLHAMLDVILASLVKLFKTGLKWNLVYKGEVHNDIELVFFVPFIRCDTDEADKLCGSYTSRGKNVSQLCRYCMCPTNESDDEFANYRKKTPEHIQKLVDKQDLVKLKELSQQCIENAFYKVRFGAHSGQGVHGACPIEMLHAMLLGIFATVRDTFFHQVGPKSALAIQLNILASEFGSLLSRQSDRDLPKTKFSGGIRRGKLMAKEYTGIMLVLLITIKSAKGQEMLKKRVHFRLKSTITDWIMLLETLLQWNEWLNSTTMPMKDVIRCPKKHRYIMQLIKKISHREVGMGLKTTKFHCILHMVEDMVAYGVPLEVDTSFNEMHHKPSKMAAALTQKDKSKFEEQVHARMEEMHLLALAEEEMEGRFVANYYDGHEYDKPVVKVKPNHTGGKAFFVSTHPQSGRNFMYDTVGIGGKCKEVRVEVDLINFLVDLQDRVNLDIPRIALKSLHKRDGHLFRGHMRFRGSVWRDWVVVDWGAGYGKIPNKIWGFVDLSKLRNNSRIKFGGITQLQPTVYAVVESVVILTSDENTELLREVETEVEDFSPQGYVSKLKFYLAPVDAFVEPAAVVPNIGGKTNSYLWLTGRQNWRDLFVTWLHKPYQDLTKKDPSDEPSGDDTGLSESDEGEDDDISEASTDAEQEEEDQTALVSEDEEADEVESDDEVEEY